uniref:Protein kinase domain-containing protein n=1 Tax=Ananas comosus var. bracteatus TaxID=296719 RepID=A0A6V7NEJ0_ANACO|nr:unnamed protein product [Ananas comosus var. bracteatus]
MASLSSPPPLPSAAAALRRARRPAPIAAANSKETRATAEKARVLRVLRRETRATEGGTTPCITPPSPHPTISRFKTTILNILEMGEYFAMKAMDKNVMLNRNKVHRATAEREILDMLDHPFLPTLYASFQTKTHICLITDYCPGGELFLLLDKATFEDHYDTIYFRSLANHKLVGSIPPEIGQLNHLQLLALQANSLYGTIPRELGNCTELQYLYLQGNYLSGFIPPEFGNLVGLETLDLSSNILSGFIPPSLDKLTKLMSFNVSMNFLT